ncbi:MAG: beta-ketoacyl-ACP synthase II [Candidatus Hydrothermales bacterium]
MKEREVVVTGIGILTSLGRTKDENFENLLKGKSGVSRIERFDTSNLPSKIAAEIKNFNPEERLSSKEIKRQDLYTIYSLYVTEEALEDAGWGNGFPYKGEDVGVIISSGIGGIITLEEEIRKMYERGVKWVSPFLVPMMIPDIASGVISIKYGFKGPNFSVVSACASSAHAIGEAMLLIKNGHAKAIIVGGSEAPLTPIALAGFGNMKALSTRNDEPEKASRPFDKLRDGFVMAEGCAVLVLEEKESAMKRGARIYAELVGYGATADAYHITAPCVDGEGAYRSMKRACESASVDPMEIDYINSHGTATPRGDVAETLAIKRLLGERAYKIPINSTKSMVGHLLGGAGALEAGVTVLSIYHKKVHPTINLEYPDPECDLDYVKEGAREVDIRYALSNSFGFGGHNCSLLFKRFEG